MSRHRHRRPPEPGEFRDPLSNYSAPEYGDELERSLCEDPVTVIDSMPADAIGPGMSVREAVERMASKNTGCLVVVEGGRPIGILSERDVLNRIAERYAELADRPVSEVMTKEPVVVHDTDTPARVLNLMSTGRFRHVPVVDADGHPCGMLSATNVTAYLRRYFAEDVAEET